jgi:hypothetical protein
MEHPSAAALEAGLDRVRRAPADGGRVDLIVRRPAEDAREVRDLQVTVMSSRLAALVAGRADRRQLAGDQLYVDLDLSIANLPPGSRLAVGSAVIEVSDKPHRGCKKFSERFGLDALRLVNSEVGSELRLRGLNARVVAEGTVRVGDAVRKQPA